MRIDAEVLGAILSVIAIVSAILKISNTIRGMETRLKENISQVQNTLEKKDLVMESLIDKTNTQT